MMNIENAMIKGRCGEFGLIEGYCECCDQEKEVIEYRDICVECAEIKDNRGE